MNNPFEQQKLHLNLKMLLKAKGEINNEIGLAILETLINLFNFKIINYLHRYNLKWMDNTVWALPYYILYLPTMFFLK